MRTRGPHFTLRVGPATSRACACPKPRVCAFWLRAWPPRTATFAHPPCAGARPKLSPARTTRQVTRPNAARACALRSWRVPVAGWAGDPRARCPARPCGGFSCLPWALASRRHQRGAPSTARSRSPAWRFWRRACPHECGVFLRARTRRLGWSRSCLLPDPVQPFFWSSYSACRSASKTPASLPRRSCANPGAMRCRPLLRASRGLLSALVFLGLGVLCWLVPAAARAAQGAVPAKPAAPVTAPARPAPEEPEIEPRPDSPRAALQRYLELSHKRRYAEAGELLEVPHGHAPRRAAARRAGSPCHLRSGQDLGR
jgi:hypothetical protein